MNINMFVMTVFSIFLSSCLTTMSLESYPFHTSDRPCPGPPTGTRASMYGFMVQEPLWRTHILLRFGQTSPLLGISEGHHRWSREGEIINARILGMVLVWAHSDQV